MTKIFDKGDLWIETFDIARSSVAGNTSSQISVILDKPGRFVGATISKDDALIASDARDLNIQISKSDASELVYGDALTTILLTRRNGTGVARIFGVHAVVFLKK